MKKIVSVAIASLFASNAFANEGLYLLGGGVSKHYKDSNQNEVHYSMGLEYNGFSIIFIKENSIEQRSIQIAYSENWYESTYVDLGFRVGVASGYKKGTRYNEGKRYYNGVEIGSTGLIPLVAAEVTLHSPIPNLDAVIDFAPNVAMFGFKYKI